MWLVPIAIAAAGFSSNLKAMDWPDPRTPMPTKENWKDPGFLNLEWIQSPNYGKRPHGVADVTTIVIHSTVTPTLYLTTDTFQRDEKHTKSAVSSHFTIGRDGSIIQNVSTFARAWHAGKSWDAEGRNNVNDYSIGIELVNLNNGKDPYPEPQIVALCGIIAEMRRRFPIKQLVSHEFIAQPPGRKDDPKAFPWDRLKYFGLPMYTGENKTGPKPKGS